MGVFSLERGLDMKKTLFALYTAALLLLLSGCSAPDSLQLDLSQGYGRETKLLHLNASNERNRRRIEDFAAVTEGAQPLQKDISLFAYYPDMTLTITRDGQAGPTAVLDINGDYVDFHYLGETQLYRSAMSSEELKKLVHQPAKE